MSVDNLKTSPPVGRMEPETPPLDDLERGTQISIAISLKRIADVFDKFSPLIDLLKRAADEEQERKRGRKP